MLILEIKQAERALADGRLDDACELAAIERVRAHARGQRLITALVAALVERARGHLAAGATAQAAADCDKAARLGGNLRQVAELRQAAAEAALAAQQAQRRQADAIRAAREHIDNDRLSAGEAALDAALGPGTEGAKAPADARAEDLRRQAADRRDRIQAAARRAEDALQCGRWEEAVDAVLSAGEAPRGRPELAETAARVTASGVERVRSALGEGRCDLAEALLERLACLGGSTEVRQLGRVLDQCREARAWLAAGRPREAGLILRRLAAILPRAAWLAEAAEQARRAAEALDGLDGGPLGLFDGGREPMGGLHARRQRGHGTQPDYAAARGAMPASFAGMSEAAGNGDQGEATLDQTEARHARGQRGHGARSPGHGARSGAAVPRRFMLLVDGVGGYLVLRDARITIGAVSSPAQPDLGLIADPLLPGGAIERIDEDYFFRPAGPAAEALGHDRLLTEGDVIALSPRCRLKFHRPNAASTSATLSLAGGQLPQADARRVILLDREIVIGPGPAAHVRADALTGPAVLHLRDGRLLVRAADEVRVDGRPAASPAAVNLGTPVSVGPISFVVKEA